MSDDPRLIITVEQALALLNPGDTIHSLRSAPGVLVGFDLSRRSAELLIRNARELEIGGAQCRALGHPLVVHAAGGGYQFIEADAARVDALEAQHNGEST